MALPSFRGHIVNDIGFTAAARVPDPSRLVEAYHQSASTLNLLRAFTKGGFADLNRVHQWTQQFVAPSPEVQNYEPPRRRDRPGAALHEGVRTRHRCHPGPARRRLLHLPRGALLGYEEALTRQDSLTGDFYDCSAHMVWIGERTRQIDGAHVEFFRGISNPIGCKVGPTVTPDEVVELCEALNPDRIPGRLTLITRMGVDHIEDGLRPLLRAVADAGPPRGLGVRSDARQHLHRGRAAARPATSTRSSARSVGSSQPIGPRAPGRVGSTSSSPATT